MNAVDPTLGIGDDYHDGMVSRDSPVLRPMRLQLRLSPSPPPQVTEVSRRSPNPDPTRERSSNRRKIKPSLGDAVLIRFMTDGRDPNIANFEADRVFSDHSDVDETTDDEGNPAPEPEKEGDADLDDNQHGSSSSPNRNTVDPSFRLGPNRSLLADTKYTPRSQGSDPIVLSPSTSSRPTLPSFATLVAPDQSPSPTTLDHDLIMEDSDEDEDQQMTSPEEKEQQRHSPDEVSDKLESKASAGSRISSQELQLRAAGEKISKWQNAEKDTVMAEPHANPDDNDDNDNDNGVSIAGQPRLPRLPPVLPKPVAADEITALAARALFQTTMSRPTSKSKKGPAAGMERTPLPGSRAERSVPRPMPIVKSEPSQLRAIASAVTSPGEAASQTSRSSGGHIPAATGDAPTVSSTGSTTLSSHTPSSVYAASDLSSPPAFSPGSIVVGASPRRAPVFEHPQFRARQPPPTILPALQIQPSSYSSPPSSAFSRVTLSPITSDHAGSRGLSRSSYDHVLGNGAASTAQSPKTTTLPPIDQYIANSEKAENSPGASDVRQFSHPHPSPRLQLPPISSHASPPDPASPHSTQYYISSAPSSTYSGSRRSTFDLGADANAGPAAQSQTLPPIQHHLRHPLPNSATLPPPSSQKQPPVPPTLARPVMNSASGNNSHNDLHKRHVHGPPIFAKPLLARPPEQALSHAQGPPKPRQHQLSPNQKQGQPTASSTLGQGTYRCNVPGCTAQPFVTQYLLNSHANVHSEERPHYCPVEGCQRSKPGHGFKRKNEMNRHGLVHKSPGYVCPFCPGREHKYPRPDNLLRHVRAHHKDKNKDDPDLRDVLAQRPDGPKRGRRRRN